MTYYSIAFITYFLFPTYNSYDLGEQCQDFFSEGSILTYFTNSKKYGEITIKSSCFIEKNEDSRLKIKSTFKWVSDTSFTLTILKAKGDVGSLKKGMQMVIEITRIEGDKAYYKFQGKEDGIERYYLKLK